MVNVMDATFSFLSFHREENVLLHWACRNGIFVFLFSGVFLCFGLLLCINCENIDFITPDASPSEGAVLRRRKHARSLEDEAATILI